MKKFKGSGDTPQTPGFQKIADRLGKPAKQISHEMIPNSRAIATGPSTSYAKTSPADANGKGQIGMNILSMGKSGMSLK